MINNEHIQNVTTCLLPVDSIAETVFCDLHTKLQAENLARRRYVGEIVIN